MRIMLDVDGFSCPGVSWLREKRRHTSGSLGTYCYMSAKYDDDKWAHVEAWDFEGDGPTEDQMREQLTAVVRHKLKEKKELDDAVERLSTLAKLPPRLIDPATLEERVRTLEMQVHQILMNQNMSGLGAGR